MAAGNAAQRSDRSGTYPSQARIFGDQTLPEINAFSIFSRTSRSLRYAAFPAVIDGKNNGDCIDMLYATESVKSERTSMHLAVELGVWSCF